MSFEIHFLLFSIGLLLLIVRLRSWLRTAWLAFNLPGPPALPLIGNAHYILKDESKFDDWISLEENFSLFFLFFLFFFLLSNAGFGLQRLQKLREHHKRMDKFRSDCCGFRAETRSSHPVQFEKWKGHFSRSHAQFNRRRTYCLKRWAPRKKHFPIFLLLPPYFVILCNNPKGKNGNRTENLSSLVSIRTFWKFSCRLL